MESERNPHLPWQMRLEQQRRQAVWMRMQEMFAQAQELRQRAARARARAQQTRAQAYWCRTCAYAVRLVRQRVYQDIMDREASTLSTPAARRSRSAA
jgi:vacuolar-type H+-ATPase subunit D/Vma8